MSSDTIGVIVGAVIAGLFAGVLKIMAYLRSVKVAAAEVVRLGGLTVKAVTAVADTNAKQDQKLSEIKEGTITVIALVDGRYSEVVQGLADSISSNADVLQELADVKAMVAEFTGLPSDLEKAAKAQGRADAQVEKAETAQRAAADQAARVVAAKAGPTSHEEPA